MNTQIHSLLCLLVTSITSAYATDSTYWDKPAPDLIYDNVSAVNILQDIECISQQLDPSNKGLHFVTAPHDYYNWPDAPVTLHLTNISLRQSIQYLSEVCGLLPIFGTHNVFLCGSQLGGPPRVHRAGIAGRLVDVETHSPITNAVFVSERHRTNAVATLPDGRFMGAIDYYINRPFCDGVFIYRTEDDEYDITVSAPGYDSQTIKVMGGDQQADEILIEMKKCQQAVPGYPPQGVGSPEP